MDFTTRVLEQGIADATELIGKRFIAFLDEPDDPESNHKFRVSIRTSRSLLAFLQPWQKPKQNTRMQKSLKKVVRETSRLRELDVLEEMVRSRDGSSEQLVSLCAATARQERTRTLGVLCDPDYVELLSYSIAQGSSLEWSKYVVELGLYSGSISLAFREMAETLQADLAVLDENDYETVHDVRKRVKQLRYVAESFPEVLDDNAPEIARSMKSEQDRLGALCDSKVNKDIVAAFLADDSIPRGLAEELSRLNL